MFVFMLPIIFLIVKINGIYFGYKHKNSNSLKFANFLSHAFTLL